MKKIIIVLCLSLILAISFLPASPVSSAPTTWTGATGRNYAYGLTTDGIYNYIGGSEYAGGPAWIDKVEIATNQTVLTWHGTFDQGNLIGLVYLNGAVYACLQSISIYPSHVIKVWTDTMTTAWVWDDPDEIAGTLLYGNEAGITTDDTYIYFGREQGVSKIWKLAQDGAEAGLWILPGGGAQRIFTMTVYKPTGMLYAVADSNNWANGMALLYEISTATMTTVSKYVPTNDDAFGQGVTVDDTGTNVYVATRQIYNEGNSPIRVSQISLATKTKVNQWRAPAGQLGSGQGMTFANGYLLVPTYFSSRPEQLVMLDTTMTPVWTLDAPAGMTGMYNILASATNLTLGFFNYSNPPTTPATMVTMPFPVINPPTPAPTPTPSPTPTPTPTPTPSPTLRGIVVVPEGQTSAVIYHALRITPAFVAISPTSDVTGMQYWVSKNDTTFTLHLSIPARVGQTFDWEVR